MAVINAVGNSLTGLTGTGNFVGANTPTLITPVLGVATATSINFGGGALSSYIPKTSWTPSFTFVTPGDLSVVYTIQTGSYLKVGDGWIMKGLLSFTPTFTTASGAAIIADFPVTFDTSSWYMGVWNNNANVIYGAGHTMLSVNSISSSTTANLRSNGSTTASALLTTASFVSGVATVINFSGTVAS